MRQPMRNPDGSWEFDGKTAPRLLDLFCCEGGASVGYARAGFAVVGVDLEDKSKRYPYEFHQADALDFVKEHGHEFDAIAASPPCQAYSVTRHSHSVQHVELIGPTRDALEATGKPYVIENVYGAKDRMISPMLLCGSMFGLTATDTDDTPLRMERHRLFESNLPLLAPGPCQHDRRIQVAGSYGGARGTVEAAKERAGGYVPQKPVIEQLLGIDWMTLHGLHQSIPPIYTQYIGEQLLDRLDGASV